MGSSRKILFPLWALLLMGFAGDVPTPARAAASFPRQNLSRFTATHWNAAFELIAALPLPQRIACWADLAAVDSVYAADPLGEGPGNLPDADPLCDFARVDCVTYLEQVYALALSPNYAAFPDTLRRIRYRDGQVDYRWRNHYFVSDWLPANARLVRDATDEVGAGHLRAMTKTISRGKFFAGKGLPQYADLPDEEATTNYIPRGDVKAVAEKLQIGDMIVFVLDTPGIIAGHTGLIRMRNGVAFLQHASLTAKTVVTVPLAEYLRAAPARFLGFKIARPYEPAPAKP